MLLPLPTAGFVCTSRWTRSTRSAGRNLSLTQHRLDAGIQPLAVFLIEVPRGDDDDWDVLPASLLLQGSDHRKAVHLRHHQIEQDHVRLVLLDTFQRLATVLCLPYSPLPELELAGFNLGEVKHPARTGRRASIEIDWATRQQHNIMIFD